MKMTVPKRFAHFHPSRRAAGSSQSVVHLFFATLGEVGY